MHRSIVLVSGGEKISRIRSSLRCISSCHMPGSRTNASPLRKPRSLSLPMRCTTAQVPLAACERFPIHNKQARCCFSVLIVMPVDWVRAPACCWRIWAKKQFCRLWRPCCGPINRISRSISDLLCIRVIWALLPGCTTLKPTSWFMD